MTSGSRSRSGCYTCRIRKKKCDEQLPRCGNCVIRNLQCYGYDVPPPDWMQGKRGWKEIMLTPEARELQSKAEEQYNTRRRKGRDALARPTGGVPDHQEPGVLTVRGKTSSAPESIWWDAGVCSSLPSDRSPSQDARLLKLYLDFIFPIQFTFYPMSAAADRSWLITSLCSNKARFHAALTVSACYETSLRESGKIDGLGMSSDVTERQAATSSTLQAMIAQFSQQKRGEKEIIKIGMQILEVMQQLLSLETFSMLGGSWELHHQATRTLLNTLHAYHIPQQQGSIALQESPLEKALKDSSSPDNQRSVHFHVTCVVWIDVVSNATFGSPPHIPRTWDYIPLLHSNILKTQEIMGCHSSVMANIAEVTCLADWKISQLQSHSLDANELSERAALMSIRLIDKIQELEQQSIIEMTHVQAESHLVSQVYAHATQVYLHVVVFGPVPTDPELSLLVNRSLQLLESLPHRPMIRVNWAFTVLGCMSDKSQYDRFRGLVGRLVAQRQPLGLTWKGLMVMEECWRLRESDATLAKCCDWKMAMESLGARVLLA